MVHKLAAVSLSPTSGPCGSVIEHPLRHWAVVGSNPGCAIPKALKMVPVATLLGAQHYKANTRFSCPKKSKKKLSPIIINLYSSKDLMEDWQLC